MNDMMNPYHVIFVIIPWPHILGIAACVNSYRAETSYRPIGCLTSYRPTVVLLAAILNMITGHVHARDTRAVCYVGVRYCRQRLAWARAEFRFSCVCTQKGEES